MMMVIPFRPKPCWIQSSTTGSVREPGKTERGREGEGAGREKSESARDGENIRGLKKKKKKR